jgi:hypothetical protein
MNNASNCDGMAKCLPEYIPIFRGLASRGRCFPHIINLIAKVLLSSFLNLLIFNKLTIIHILDFHLFLFQTAK